MRIIGNLLSDGGDLLDDGSDLLGDGVDLLEDDCCTEMSRGNGNSKVSLMNGPTYGPTD